MGQITVEKLWQDLTKLVKNGEGNKKVVISDDNEGNGYHGCFFTTTHKPAIVKQCIDCSAGLCDTETEDYNNIVIIG